MWRPHEVVPQHRHQAVLIWAFLIVSILSYAGLLLYRAVSDRENPSTSLIISNEIYTYPDLWVCLYDTFGCDTLGSEEDCINSIFDTEGGSTKASYRPGDEDEVNISFTPKLTDGRGWCAVFETSALEYNLGEERDADDYIDYVAVDMYWYPGGIANNSTTCIQEEGAWTPHKENIFAFLNDPITSEVSAGIQIPYSCMTNESNSHYFTYVGIGVTKQHKLDEAGSASYNALNLGTIEYKVEKNTTIQAPYAYMKVELQQEPNSLVVVTEIDPLDAAEILGQVGGFWDLILIFWPIFFVAASEATPHLKPRNFRKSAARAKENLTSVGPAILHNLSVAAFTTRDPPQSSSHHEQAEMLPAWEKGAPSCRQQQGNVVLIRLFEDHGLVAVIKATSRLSIFLRSEFGASYLRRGAPEPSLEKLLPAKTFLVMVPTNATALSVATRVARHCKDFSGQTNSEQVVVKVTRVSCSRRQSQALEASSYLPVGNDVDESVVDIGEESVDHGFTPALSGEGTRQRKRISAFIQWPHAPVAITPPIRRTTRAQSGETFPRFSVTPLVRAHTEGASDQN